MLSYSVLITMMISKRLTQTRFTKFLLNLGFESSISELQIHNLINQPIELGLSENRNLLILRDKASVE